MQLIQNLDSFVQKWKGITHNGQHILTQESIVEIDKLKVHASKGCLCGISVGGGTMKLFIDTSGLSQKSNRCTFSIRNDDDHHLPF